MNVVLVGYLQNGGRIIAIHAQVSHDSHTCCRVTVAVRAIRFTCFPVSDRTSNRLVETQSPWKVYKTKNKLHTSEIINVAIGAGGTLTGS